MRHKDHATADWSDALGRWTGRWRAALAAAGARGREDDTAWGVGRVDIGPPSTPDELEALEAASGLPMPGAIRRLFLTARSVEASWHLSEHVEPPRPFDGIFAGECSWSVDRVVTVVADYRSWIADVFPDPHDPYDAVWHGKYPWLQVPNGDVVALDREDRVVYLSHDDGAAHGCVLGRDVIDFLDRWTLLGCPGPEDWQWLPFLGEGGAGLDPGGEAGRAWRAWFGLP